MFLIFLGAPASGKGTQAKKICAHFNVPHISTGDIFRGLVKTDPEKGKLIASFIDFGNLVPDDIVVDIVDKRLGQDDCKDGLLLDGFPRTLYQAQKMEEFSKKYGQKVVVIKLSVDDDTLIKRVAGRRMCAACTQGYYIDIKKICGQCSLKDDKYCYGLTNVSCEKISDFLCECGGKLISRCDDDPQTFQVRLKVYNDQTAPLIDFYTKKGNLTELDGTGEMEDVFKRVVKAINTILGR
ncbi:MAG: adenylate kinase [Firmicutes bacterium]|nr:adenylate kinase [Bacillota bacterium]